MYDIYISNFNNSSGSFVSSEQLLYSIPITNPDMALIDPVVKREMGKAGTFEFSINPVHPYYNAWNQMKTIMRVEYEGTTIFRGRVLTIDNQPLTGIKKIHLEGDYAFLMDSIQEGKKEEEKSAVSLYSYLSSLIDIHNAQMQISSENYKLIYLGEVPGHYSSNISSIQRIKEETAKHGSNSWEKTSDALNRLTNEHGGYFRTRWENGRCYLDWLDYYFNPTVNSQPIKISENLIDLSSVTEVENLFTALIPVGRSEGKDIFIDDYRTDIHGNNKYILVPQIVSLFSDSELNQGYHSKAEYQNAISNYGIIFKTQSFANADTKDKLWAYAIDWIRQNYIGGISSFTISALDMHHVSSAVQKYLVGDQVRVIYPNINAHTASMTPTIEKILTVTSIQYNLYDPERNIYSIGIPNSVLSKTYGTANSKKSGGGKSTSSDIVASGGGGVISNEESNKLTVKQMDEMAWKYVVDGYTNNELYHSLKQSNPKAAQRAVNFSEAVVLRTLTDIEDPDGTYTQATKDRIASIFVDGMNARIQLAGYMPGPLAVNAKDKILQEMDLSKSIVLDGYVGQFTLEDHYNLSAAYHIPIVWTDEMKAAYITWKGVNAKPLLKITRDQKANPLGLIDSRINMRMNMMKNGIADPSDPLGLTTRSYYGSVNIDADTGTINSLVQMLSPDMDDETKARIINNGLNGTTKWMSPDKQTTGSFYSEGGIMGFIKGIVGTDGTGNKGTIDLNGMLSSISLKNVLNAGSTDPAHTTVDLTGADGSLGLGKDSGANWIVTANKKISYEDVDEQGHIVVRVIDGGVHATDFHVNAVGSFATKFAAIDTLVARKAFISDLEAAVARVGDLEVTSGELQADMSTIKGSALWVRRDKITGVVGDFRIDNVGGQETLVIISGGGLQIERNNTKFGVYDNGNLTGGVMVDKINDGSVTTKIKGDRVDIEARQVKIGSTTNVQAWMNTTDVWKDNADDTFETHAGLIADRATIYQLNAVKARVESLEADSITAQWLAANDIVTGDIDARNLDVNNIVCADFRTPGVVDAGNVYAGGLSLNGSSYFTDCVISASVSNNTLTLTKASGGRVTFSKATTLSGAWSGAKLTVTAKQNDTEVATWNRTYTATVGTGTASPPANITKTINAFDTNNKAYGYVGCGDDGSYTLFNVDATSAYNSGYNKAKPTGSVTVGTKIAGTNVFNISVKKTDGGSVAGTLSATNFVNAVDITLQGTSHPVTPINSNSAIKIKAVNNLYKAGTSTVYARGSAVTRYLRSSTSYTPSTKTGTNRGSNSYSFSYKKVYNSSGTSLGYHWVSSGTSGGSTLYASGSSYSYNHVDTTSKLWVAGDSVTDYLGNGGEYTVQGSATSAYVGATDGTTYYKAGTQLNLYNAGTRYNKTTYYTMK